MLPMSSRRVARRLAAALLAHAADATRSIILSVELRSPARVARLMRGSLGGLVRRLVMKQAIVVVWLVYFRSGNT